MAQARKGGSGRADARDAEIGRRVRSRRLECRLSQVELGDRIGITFQQIQKYEKGISRIGAGRLQRIADTLEVPITFFFDGPANSATRDVNRGGEKPMGGTPDSQDREIGSRIRSRRLECGLSQSGLAERVGLTFQQLQNYEKGASRIGAARLQQIAEALDVPIVFFF
jgi:transcriptional regulator with XRE-family HTH domain